MSEETYRQIEDAIERKLHVFLQETRADMGGPAVYRPLRIENGDVTMIYCNSGGGTPQPWTLERWNRETGDGKYLYRKVGIWEFALDTDPAASEIASACRNPAGAGRRVYELEQEISRLRAQIERIES